MAVTAYGHVRVYNDHIVVLNSSSINDNHMTVENLKTNPADAENELRITVDTVNETFAVQVNDGATVSTGSSVQVNMGRTPQGYLSTLTVNGMERMTEGSYFRFLSLEVQQYDTADGTVTYPEETQRILDLLPDSLVADPYHVQTHISLPTAIGGLLWQTSNADVISKFGRITKTEEGAAEAELSLMLDAFCGAQPIQVTKSYRLTVTGVNPSTNHNTINPNPANEELWYTMPDTYDGYPLYGDPGYITDENFFGVWDAASQTWSTPGCFRYADYPAMAEVEAAVKLGDYAAAKTALLSYYRSVADTRISRASKPADKYKVYYELLSRNAYATGFISGQAIDVFEVGKSFQTVSVDVTTHLNEAKGSFSIFSNMIASIDKYCNQAEIYSKDSAHPPVLKVKINGEENERTFACVKDGTIRGGSYADVNYGADELMYAEESGTWQNYDDRVKRIFLGFDISGLKSTDTVTSARIELYARHNGTPDSKMLVYYWYNDGSWKEDTLCWNTFSDPLYFSCNDQECWDYVTSNRPSIKGKVCGYHRDVEPAYLANLYSYYSSVEETAADAEKYAYTYLRQYLGLIHSIGIEPDVMNQLDMSTHISGVSTDILRLIDSAYMSPEIFTTFLKHLWNLTDYHAYYWFGKANNNFATFSTGAVYNMCARFPEFQRHDDWFNLTVAENDRVFTGLTFEDGLCLELSHNYISTLLSTLSSPISTSNKTGEPLPYSEAVTTDIYNMVYSLLNTSGPYFGGFNMGDGYDPYTSYKSVFRRWYNYYFNNDPAIAYMATDGQLGWLPENPTTNYPVGQKTVMRSDWGQNALALAMSNKMVGSHGHRDALNIAMFAYGKYLLTDQGYGSIQTGSTAYYMRGPQQHNVVTVNDYADYLKTNDYSSFSSMTTTDGEQLAFESNGLYDFVEYSTPAYKETELSQRSVLFLRNQKFWIVTDYLIPADAEAQNVYTQNWHLYPGAQMTIDSDKVIRSNFENEPNVQLVPVAPEEIDSTEIRDTWYSEKGGQLLDSQKAMYYKTKSGTTVFGTVMVPMDVGEDFEVQTAKLDCGLDENEVNCFSFTIKNKNTSELNRYYYYHLNRPELKQAVTVGNYSTDAATLLVQEDAAGNFVSAFIMDGTFLKSGSSTLFENTDGVSALAFSVDAGTLQIDTSAAGRSVLNGCRFHSSLGSAVQFGGGEVAHTVLDGMICFIDIEDVPADVDEGTGGTVILDSSVNPELLDWEVKQHAYYKATDLGADGLKVENVETKPFLEDGSNNSAASFSATLRCSGMLEADGEHQTAVIADGFHGTYAYEYTIQNHLQTQREVPTYITINFGERSAAAPYQLSSNWMELRLYNEQINAIRYEHTQPDGIRNDSNKLSGQTLEADTEWKLRVVFDTVSQTYTVYVNGVQALGATKFPFHVNTGGDFIPDVFGEADGR